MDMTEAALGPDRSVVVEEEAVLQGGGVATGQAVTSGGRAVAAKMAQEAGAPGEGRAAGWEGKAGVAAEGRVEVGVGTHVQEAWRALPAQ